MESLGKMPAQTKSVFERFHEVVENRHDYAQEWKARTGGKVIGFLCTYVPEEIIYAAGALPVRILGGLQPQEISEAHISGMYCTFCRDCLAQGLLGRYSYLDGIVFAKSCMHIQQTYWSWNWHLSPSYSYFVGMPSVLGTPQAKKKLVFELSSFKTSLEKWLGKTITDENLDQGIDSVNINRHYLRDLYELRKADPPLLSGKEAATVALSSMLSDKKEHSAWLGQFISELPHRHNGLKRRPRLMVIGSENHDLELYQIIEDVGANIVVEESCVGSRYFWNQVTPQADRLSAIADRYLTRPRCPLKDLPERQRPSHILNLATDWQVQGAILIQQKFCWPHGFDLPAIDRVLKENGIPTTSLELDITLHRASVRTRAEALLEMLVI